VRPVLPLAALLACAPEPCPSGSARRDDGLCVLTGGATSGDAASTQTQPEPDPFVRPPRADWTAADAEQAFEEAVAVLPDPASLDAAWMGLFDHREGDCPSLEGYNFDHAVEGCGTTDGWVFAGPAEYYSDTEGGRSLDLTADVYVVAPDATLASLSLAVHHGRQGEGEDAYAEGGLATYLVWPGQDGWLADSSTTLEYRGTASALVLRGGTRIGATPALWMNEAVVGGDCGAEGPAAVRTPDGRWVDVDLACGGCGPATLGGEDLGEVCLPVDALRAWATALVAF
jgi:hypothetical protein